jgi:hypothetical protein
LETRHPVVASRRVSKPSLTVTVVPTSVRDSPMNIVLLILTLLLPVYDCVITTKEAKHLYPK